MFSLTCQRSETGKPNKKKKTIIYYKYFHGFNKKTDNNKNAKSALQ